MVMMHDLAIFTLNCWGIPFISKDRCERIKAIASYLALGKHNIVCLQEIWSEGDFLLIKDFVKEVLPYSHYFYSGVAGSGLCVLSEWPIEDVFFYPWPLNGYIHKLQHGDWFGGKGVGLCRIRCGNILLHVYCTHLHAEYGANAAQDTYRAHRVLQALGAAELVRFTAAGAHLCLLAGDLNTEPHDISYRVMLELCSLTDPHCSPELAVGSGGTSDNFRNSYSDPTCVQLQPEGKRIDHILYRARPGMHVHPTFYGNPLPDRVPGHSFSYSDHHAVSFECRVTETDRATAWIQSPTDPEVGALITTAGEARAVLVEGVSRLYGSRRFYAAWSACLLLALVMASGPWPQSWMQHAVRVVLTGLALYCLLMATAWHRIELNGLRAGVETLDNLLAVAGVHATCTRAP